MNLTTTEAVAALLSGAGDLSETRRTELSAVVVGVSGAAERYLGRLVLRQSRTEYHDVEAGQTMFRLRAFPVTALTNAWFDIEQDFATALTAGTDYFDPTLDESGLFETRYPLSSSRCPKALKVTYTGGMATDTDSFIAAYPDISHAVAVQCAHEWQRRGALGVSSINYPDGTTASMTPERWIPSVKQVLDWYRATRFA